MEASMKQSYFEILHLIFDPTTGAAPLITLIALASFVVVGMAVYAVMLALKRR
jgi:hypothetical protein